MELATDGTDPDRDRTTRATTLEQLTRPLSRSADEARAFTLDDDLWALALPLPYIILRSVNAYLIKLADGLALVDCGSSLPPTWDALNRAVAITGHQLADVNLLICTHLHMDHAGLADTVARRIGCQLARGPGPDNWHDGFRDRRIPLDQRRQRAVGEGVPASELRALVGPLVADDGHQRRPRFDRVLEPGELLVGVGDEWQVVPAQGHAAAQIVLFARRRRWLISADIAIVPPMLEWGSQADPVAAHRESLERMLALGAERLLPGHGRPIEPAVAARKRLLAARDALDESVSRARAAIAAAPCSAYELSELLQPGERDLEWRQSSLSLALCLLEHLEATGGATSMAGDDGVRRFVPTAARPAGGREDRRV